MQTLRGDGKNAQNRVVGASLSWNLPFGPGGQADGRAPGPSSRKTSARCRNSPGPDGLAAGSVSARRQRAGPRRRLRRPRRSRAAWKRGLRAAQLASRKRVVRASRYRASSRSPRASLWSIRIMPTVELTRSAGLRGATRRTRAPRRLTGPVARRAGSSPSAPFTRTGASRRRRTGD